MRSVLNITITQMVYRPGVSNIIADDTCPPTDLNEQTERDGYHWSQEMQGHILGAFFYGYVNF